MRVIFTERAKRDWQRLHRPVQAHIKEKLVFYLKNAQPLQFAEKLRDRSLGEYRFRIGDYRLIFDFERGTIFVLRVGHRRDIYR